MKILKLWVLIALAAGLEGVQESETHPSVTLQLASKSAKPGSKLRGKVVVTFSPGLHAYQNPPTMDFNIPLKVESATKGVGLRPTYPKGVMKEFAGDSVAVYEGTVAIPFEATLPKRLGKVELKLKVTYQQCNESGCFPPSSKSVAATVLLRTSSKSPSRATLK